MNNSEKTAKLTLLLIYLTSWDEKDLVSNMRRAWKGYDFDTLDKLEEDGLISQSKTAKSVYLTEKGLNVRRTG
ncbi:MAG: transposase [Bacteroidetes bacterium]|nr:MAG: transposase [Bacteroidota bacterium]